MKRLAIIFLLIVIPEIMARNCPDFSVSSPDCLYKDSDSWPKYSDGSPYEVGKYTCIGSNREPEKFKYVKQGIPLVLVAYRMICRKIESIEKHFYADFDCCQNKIGRNHPSYKKCVDGEISFCNTKFFYWTRYSEELDENAPFDETSMIWELDNDPNVVRMGDSVEVFRDDGTLKYRGYMSLKRAAAGNKEPVRTSGFCYDRSGKQTKRVNNADVCK